MNVSAASSIEKPSSRTESQTRRRFFALAALAAVGAGLSAWLAAHTYEVQGGTAGFKSLCNLGEAMNCDAVAASPYAMLLPGFPLASFGAGWYVALLVTALFALDRFWRREALRFAFVLAAGGLALSLAYLAIMAGVLHVYCLFCLGLDAVALVTFGYVLWLRPEPTRTHKPELSRWKTLAIAAAVSIVASAGALKTFDAGSPSSAAVDDLVTGFYGRPVVSVATGADLPSLGPTTARVTVVEFSDFQCPHCRIGAFTINAVLRKYPNDVRVIFRNFPIDSGCNREMPRPMHPFACEAAKTAWCAHKQGRFQPVFESIFQHQDALAPGKVAELAREAGADPAVLAGCVASDEAKAAISRDVEEAIQLGVGSTPTFFVNGRRMEGAYPPAVWDRIIARELASAK